MKYTPYTFLFLFALLNAIVSVIVVVIALTGRHPINWFAVSAFGGWAVVLFSLIEHGRDE